MVASTTSRPSAAPAMEQRLDHLQVAHPCGFGLYKGRPFFAARTREPAQPGGSLHSSTSEHSIFKFELLPSNLQLLNPSRYPFAAKSSQYYTILLINYQHCEKIPH